MGNLRDKAEKSQSAGDETLADRLREIFEYDPETGELFWKRSLAGTINGEGYSQVYFDGKLIGSHRVIFAMMTCRFPEEVDHINRHRADNKWSNLREVNRSQNMLNAGMLRNNTSGAKGVYWNKSNSRWHARIEIDGRKRHLGYFTDIDEASKAYERARIHFLAGGT